MPYTVNQIKVYAYNRDEQKDFSEDERNLFLGLQYAYDWFRLNPEDKEECEKLMQEYVEWYNQSSLRVIG